MRTRADIELSNEVSVLGAGFLVFPSSLFQGQSHKNYPALAGTYFHRLTSVFSLGKLLLMVFDYHMHFLRISLVYIFSMV